MSLVKKLNLLYGWKIVAETSTNLPDCTLIIPTYRRPGELLALLEKLTEISDVPGEVIIVDGSPDDTVDQTVRLWTEGRSISFDLVFINSPAGLTRQRNVGIDASTREYIFFLDDDCIPEANYFRAIRQVFLNDTSHRIGAVRGFLTNGIQKPMTQLWRLRFALGVLPKSEPGRYHPSGTSGTWDMVPPFSGIRPIDVLAGGASAYRRQVFEKHRFSEFFYGYAQGEDLEMSLRIGKDWELVVCGDARLFHDHAESGRPAGFPRGRMAVRNRHFIWKRHSPDASLTDRIRFWGDHLLVTFYYLAGFLVRPWRGYFLAYAAGTMLGAIECLVSPPKHREPPAEREHDFRLKSLAPKQKISPEQSTCLPA